MVGHPATVGHTAAVGHPATAGHPVVVGHFHCSTGWAGGVLLQLELRSEPEVYVMITANIRFVRHTSISPTDVDCFYIALFSALKQTHCACMRFYMSD